MGALSEVAVDDVIKKKSKKRKHRDGDLQVGNEGNKKNETGSLFNTSTSEAVDVVSSGDMHNNSNKERKEKDKRRKEKKEKNRSGIDMKDKVNDLKKDKKKNKKQMGSDESNTGISTDEVVGDGLKQLKEEDELACKEGKVKKMSKKNKKQLSHKEPEYAIENDSFGHDRSVENQVENEVIESIEPAAPDRKRKKKKRDKDSGAEFLHDSDIHSISHAENRGSSCSKKKNENSGASISEDTSIGVSVSSEWDCASGDDKVAKKVASKKDNKTKKKKKDKGGSSSPNNGETSVSGHSKSKKKKSMEKEANAGSSKTERKQVAETSEKPTSSKKPKKVRFSGQDEVFSLPDDSSKGEKEQDGADNENRSGDGLIRGKRFSKEEDELVKKAVLDYIEAHQLGEEGIHMVMKCKNYPEIKDCWKEIGESLPWRPYSAVYYRAHILFERGENRKWSEEELDFVRQFHEKHGANWKALADELGKHRFHVKDTWRRIKLPNRKKGNWSQEEYQSLFELVNMDLSMKVFQEKKSKHGMLRDNISWEAISEKLSTRSTPICCYKWYNQLTSPLVAEGKWSDTDDYRLLIALVDLDAACEEDVDWDNLLEHRSGEVCRKRWNQMALHIGEHGIKPFNEQVEVLSQRYCPDLLEARETYENEPYVD